MATEQNQQVYVCSGCGRIAADPDADVAAMQAAGHMTCCPERSIAAQPLHAVTLRQQAGRVDEGMVSRFKAAFAEHSTISPEYDGCIRAGIEAALAQNTQGDGEAVLLTLDSGFQIPIVRKGEGFVVDPRFPTISHTERARVLDGLKVSRWESDDRAFHFEIPFTSTLLTVCDVEADDHSEQAEFLRELAKAVLAAAPSQPNDAGEVES